MPNNRYFFLRYPVTAEGQQRKTKYANFLLECGWKIVGEAIEPGHMKGDEACCLAMICLPLGFAAGRTDDIVTISFQYDGDDKDVGPHEHHPLQLDNTPTVMCAVCNDLLTEAQVAAVEESERQRKRERASAERQAMTALKEQHEREEQQNEQQKRAERKAYLDAHPEEREKQRLRTLFWAGGIAVVLLIVIVIGIGMSMGHTHHR